VIHLDSVQLVYLTAVVAGAVAALYGLARFAYGAKYRAAWQAERAVADSYREGRAAFEARVRQLEQQLRDLTALADKEREEQRELRHRLRSELAAARLKTDLSVVLESLAETQKATASLMATLAESSTRTVIEAVNGAEQRVVKQLVALDRRHEKQTAVMDEQTRVLRAIEQRLAA
jgi:hypothetical protein